MHSQIRPQVAFRYAGLVGPGGAEPMDAPEIRPALAARYRELAQLRYDFPLALLSYCGIQRCPL